MLGLRALLMAGLLLLLSSAGAADFAGLTPGRSTAEDARRVLGTPVALERQLVFPGDKYAASEIIVDLDKAGIITFITVKPKDPPTQAQMVKWLKLGEPYCQGLRNDNELLVFLPQLVRLRVRADKVLEIAHCAPHALSQELRFRAQALDSTGQSARAIAELEKLRGLLPEDAEVCFTLASILMVNRQWEKALQVSTEGLKIDPDNTEGRTQKANLEVALGRPQATQAVGQPRAPLNATQLELKALAIRAGASVDPANRVELDQLLAMLNALSTQPASGTAEALKLGQKCFSLGCLYAKGQGVAKDEASALKCFRFGADLGFVRAQFEVGCRLAEGIGVAKDEVAAVKWYTLAANQGHADSQHNLGVMYNCGRGIARDDQAATQWYLKAAEQGQVISQMLMGRICANGWGVPKDDAKAVEWYRKAARQGSLESQVELKKRGQAW